jgi:hypothetical protein
MKTRKIGAFAGFFVADKRERPFNFYINAGWYCVYAKNILLLSYIKVGNKTNGALKWAGYLILLAI